jgi:alpha-amylase
VDQIRFAFCIHNHQPVGNLQFVFENAYDKAYRPFLEVLERHPEMKVTAHYSGSLLTWLEENRPAILDDIRRLVANGRMELLTAGFYEPILLIIPDRDKIGQITSLSGYLRDHFRADPKGLWLTERVWQPDLITPLRRAGVHYTIVDDNNLHQTGLSEKQSLHRFVARSEAGTCSCPTETLDIFPINAVLRKAIPFRSPEDALAHLRYLASDEGQLIVFADDGEKFGEWPGTHDLIYQQGWLDRFFHLLSENRDWLEMTTLSAALHEVSAHGPIDLPPGSYEEMMGWSGGDWHNFLDRYPESNLLYRKMIHVSAAVENSAPEPSPAARDYLYRGQCNDAYWHGVFGGLYLLHLRTGTYRNLLLAENALGRGETIRLEQTDYDGDGNPEVLVTMPRANVYLHRIGGQIVEFDDRESAWNLLATLTRREEPYHAQLGDSEEGRRLLPLHYDWYPRRGLIDHFFRDDVTLDGFADCEYGEQGDFVNQPYEVEVSQRSGGCDVIFTRKGGAWVGSVSTPITVRKQLQFTQDRPAITVSYQIEHGGTGDIALWFGTESNFVMSPGGAPGRYYRIQHRPSGSLGAKADFGRVSEIELVDEWLKAKVALRFGAPTNLWVFPVQTVSRGLEGPAYAYQGSSVTAHWRVKLAAGEVWGTRFVIEIGRV